MADKKFIDYEPNFELKLVDCISTVYHYTSSKGLLGILNNGKINFRFTRCDCVNDTSEGKNIIDCYQKTCNELYKESKIDKKTFKTIFKVQPKNKKQFGFMTGDTKKFIREDYKAYICCFSREQDSLPMWNYYVKDGKYQGYSIGVPDYLFSEINKKEYEQGFKVKIYEVVYKDSEKTKHLKNLILYFAEKCKNILELKWLLSFYLQDWQLAFKDECFAHENEVRLILYVPNEKPEGVTGAKEFEVEFTSKNGYIKPFITLSFPKECLEEIGIGPLAEKEISESTLKELLLRRGYGKVNIFSSKVPIRY